MDKKKIIPIILISTIVAIPLISCSSSEAKEEEESSEIGEETITIEDAEKKVREKVVLEGQELRSTLLVNDEAALESLKEIAPATILENIKVGDFFFIFSEMQVIYRPSADQIVQTVPIIKSEIITETESEPSTPDE